ncbi:MAG TPA: hypothetical protein VKB38_04270 [Terracidiphilus sp.]|nr:hypothetical protein [Terracidiphilus sp.]
MGKRAFQLFLVVCLLAGTMWAAGNPFEGKWKLNPSRSQLIDQMRVIAAGPNKYTLNFTGDNTETVVADGTDQPGLFGSTASITVLAPDTWKMVRKNGGRITISAIWKLSPDGNTLTDNFTGYRADGSTSKLLYVYKRTAGTSGFPGTWESVSEQVNSVFEIQIGIFEGDGLSFIYPSQQITTNVKFDGKDYSTSGPNIPAGVSMSGHQLSERSLELTQKIGGKVYTTQQVEVSPDLKTLIMTIHVPGRSKPDIQVFDRE